MSSFAKWSRRSKSGKDDHMNRKLNAAITAGLSLSMVLGSTPVTAIAAQVQQPAAKSATEANDWCVLNVYDEADGQHLLGISVQKGQKKVTEALEGNVPAKPGYKIDYLYTSTGLQFRYDEATNTWSGNEATVNDNMDLYVHFVKKQETPAVKKYTVTYYDEGYDPIGHYEGYDGTTAWLQRTPAPKDGKVFVGWKFVGADDSEIIPAGTELKADWNVQAVWKDAEAAVHTVTYYDEDYEPIGHAEIRAGQFNWDQVKPAAKDGYTFVGYKFTGDTDDHIIDFSKTAMPDADVCLQAVWKDAVKETHTVTYYDEGYDPIGHYEGYDGTTAWLQRTPAPKDGKVFVGWKFVGADDSEIIPAGTELKADWNVQAVWKDAEAAVHTVTYYDEDYEPIGHAEIRAGQFNWDQVKPAAKDGYTFVGYKFTGDTDDHIIDFSKTAMPDADVCLQAVWQKNAEPTPEPTENEHTVTIYENGKVSTVKVKDGEKLSKPADPEAVAGYEFVGWSTSKSEMAQYDFDQPVTGDLTIYAMFNAKKETVENGKAEDSKKQVAADKKNEAKAEKKDAAALPTTGDPIFVVTSAASLAGAVAAAVGMYMTKRREH